MNRILEIRSYNLKPGTRPQFHELMTQQSLPLLNRLQIDVVAFGPSLHDGDTYYLMRSYASLEALQQSEDAFYGSSEWRQGPREAVLALIDNYTSVVITIDEATLQGLRHH
jgi:NIPSNAP